MLGSSENKNIHNVSLCLHMSGLCDMKDQSAELISNIKFNWSENTNYENMSVTLV